MATDISKVTLTPKELDDIRKEAEALEIADLKKNLKDKALADERARLRSAIDPTEEMRSITVELAEFTDRITLDGRIYVHGQTYLVPKRVFDVLQECMFRTQQHEHEISGKARSQFKPRLAINLRPGFEALPATSLVRAAGGA